MKSCILTMFLFVFLINEKAFSREVPYDFTMSYSGFISAFEQRSWKWLVDFEAENVKCGFGPGEEGRGCIERVYKNDQSCFEDMLLALKQGCKITSSNPKEMKCTSPPQWVDDDIIILGARAAFIYDIENEKLAVRVLICGGD